MDYRKIQRAHEALSDLTEVEQQEVGKMNPRAARAMSRPQDTGQPAHGINQAKLREVEQLERARERGHVPFSTTRFNG